ncbi:replicative DNA helicase [Bremerella cremea]|uniref:Replicative DNA helicase n=1 Tax=Blastopirellula marina TaxID=124 RepID=A0A2S8G5T2_9BACT|nr:MULTISPECIES: replicative DNA helicase [Pirellulaceae]PQO39787.1 replicative DNA helicase [Blastopirellula marina]RCS51254.1 replicative DNA helicase [Bremerella cremea]
MATGGKSKQSKQRRFDDREEVATNLFDKQPPCSVEAEQCVLGSIILLPDVLDDVIMVVRPEDFYDEANKKLFEHMVDLHNSGRKIDTTLLTEHLRNAGDWEFIGGTAYLAKVARSVPHAAHAVSYAEIVRKKATSRNLILAATDILQDAYQEAGKPEELVGRAEQKIFSILDGRDNRSMASMREIVTEAMERIDARLRGETSNGVLTGFTDIDEMTSGFHGSQLLILAARPAMGKTAFAMNIAENIAVHDKIPVLFVSLEMGSVELCDRLLCSVAKVNGHRLRNGTLSNEDRAKLIERSSLVAEAPLFVDDSPSRTVAEIAASARRIMRNERRLGLIVIDYLQLIEPDNANDPRQEQVAKIARRLKGLAREMNVPILCLAQLNRQAEASKDNKPKLSHLRESGAIEQDADVVMFVHREEYYHSGEERDQYTGQAEIIIGKQRAGPVGEVKLTWLKDFTRFENAFDREPDDFSAFNQGEGGF